MAVAVGIGRWLVEPRDGNADVFYYARATLEFAGVPRADAASQAAAFTYQMLHPGHVGTYQPADLLVSADPRYAGFFAARVLYPALASLLVPFVGLWGLVVVSFCSSAVAAIAVGTAGRGITGSTALGALASLAFLISPGGRYGYWVSADAPALALVAAALVCAGAYLSRGSRFAVASCLVTSGLLAVTKVGNLDALVAAGVVVGVIGVIRRTEWRDRALMLAAGGVALGIVATVGGHVAGWPSVMDQIQDLLTQHFRTPDVASPLPQLLRRDFDARQWLTRDLALVPIGAIVFAGLAGLVLRLGPRTLPWLVAAGSAWLLVLIHPVHSDIDRVLAPLWLSVAVGSAPLAAWVIGHLRAGGRIPGYASLW